MKTWRFISSVLVVTLAFAAVSILASGQEMTAPKKPDIIETLTKAGNFTTLLKALKAANLEETLKGEGPYTLLAPDDAAWAKIPADRLERMLAPEGSEWLIRRLQTHVIKGKMTAADLKGKKTVPTLSGRELTIETKEDGTFTIDGAKITKADIEASNGLVQVIDAVIGGGEARREGGRGSVEREPSAGELPREGEKESAPSATE
jgi:uncharacterized surface protein with fasciclin (FAS1) repeats